MRDLFDSARGENVHAIGQRHGIGPGIGRIGFSTRPIDMDLAFGESLELFVQEDNAARTCFAQIDDIACEDYEINLFIACDIEDLFRRAPRRFKQRIAQCVWRFGKAERWLFKM